jgi:hypothetical protein
MQYQSMFAYGHNGIISMDATFNTNDCEISFFTLMGFDVHHTRMLLTWIIRSQQIVDDLIEWLRPLKSNILSIMSNCKPSCFIINDAPQGLRALQ